SAIPLRAATDNRLSARHFRVLMAVASHDRLGKNGQGCWVGRKKLSEEAGLSETHTSDALSDLRRFGYITSDRHVFNRRTLVHRVMYEMSQQQDALDIAIDPAKGTHQNRIDPVVDPNRSRLDPEQVPSENAKSMSRDGNRPSVILRELNIDKREEGIEL